LGDQGFVVSANTAAWIAEQLESHEITKELVLSSTVHIPPAFIRDIFSENQLRRGIATGYFYEATVYEMLLHITRSSNRIRYLTRKGADVSPERLRPYPALGQDGFFYSPLGELKIRGNGVDLAEVDFVLEDSEGGLLFGESKISGKFLANGFVEDLSYKRRLLAYLFPNEVQSILISPANLAENPQTLLLNNSWNYFAKTEGIDEVLAGLTPEEIPSMTKTTRSNEKLVYWTDFRPARQLNYSKLHSATRDAILKGVNAGVKVQDLVKEQGDSLLKNVWIGELNEQAIAALFEKKTLCIEDCNIGAELYHSRFSKIVLGLGLPECRPALYLRSKVRPSYIKLGPNTPSEFSFERLLQRKYTPYYDWLNSISVPISAPKLMDFLNYFLQEKLIGARIKRAVPKRELSELLGVELTWADKYQDSS